MRRRDAATGCGCAARPTATTGRTTRCSCSPTSRWTSSGAATWRLGTTSAAEVNLEDCNGCGVSGWGWQDNGYGTNVLGPLVYFSATGPQTLRVQTREDGFAIDQIVLSPAAYLSASPGAPKNDTRILPRTP